MGGDPGTSLWIAFSTSLFSATFDYNWRLVLVRPRWISSYDGFPFPPEKTSSKDLGFQGFLYVNNEMKKQPTQPTLVGADAVWIHAHGGGFMAGEARQYHATYRRWVRKALKDYSLDLRILAVEYPLSTAKPYPASLLSMYSAYKYCVDSGYPCSNIFVVGDSAGGNLAISTTYHILENLPSQMPAATIMFSPWMDLTQEYTGHSPNQATDWLTTFDDESTRTDCIDVYCGSLIKSRGDPRVSPLRRESLKGLPPQFVSAGKAEVLYMDSKLWADRCERELGKVETHFPERQIHTFQIGGWLASRAMEAESDGKILSFIKRQVPKK
ncbi:hypothetical protein B7463_g785, partial [Scytalidium lignicola]